MRLLTNNLIVLGVFFGTGVLIYAVANILLAASERYGVFGRIRPTTAVIFMLLMVVVVIGIFGTHFVSGRRFLRFSGNVLQDSASFLLVVVLTIIYILFAGNHETNPFNMLKSTESFFGVLLTATISPSLFVGGIMEIIIGVNYEKLSVCITVFLALLLQFLGLFIRGRCVA